MKNLNKGIVKVEKFEAVQDEDGNWVPVGNVLEKVEEQNALSTSILRKLKLNTDNDTGHFAGAPSGVGGDLTEPGLANPQIFISEFPTAFPGSIPAQRTTTTATDPIYAPNRNGYGVYHGSFRSLGYSDRDSDESKTILVLKHRFDPDISRDRSIRSIGLTHITALRLASVFTQTSSQILDVTYTIEIDLSNIEYPIFSRVEKTLKKHLSFPAAYDQSSGFLPDYSVLIPQAKLKPGVAIGIEDNLTREQYLTGGHQAIPYWNHNPASTYSFADENGYTDFNLTNQLEGIYAPSYPEIAYLDATHEAGMLLGNVMSTCRLATQKNIHEWRNSRGSVSRTTADLDLRYFISQQTIADSSDTTAIQNTFPRSGPALPYQDVDALATGTGTFIISDSDVSGGSSWTGNDDGLAKKYRINITTGGATGVSEYNVQRRNWAGSVGNSFSPRLTPLPYANIQNSSTVDSDGLGGIVVPFADDTRHGYHGQNPGRARRMTSGSFNDNILSTGLSYKYPEFITYDKTGFTVMHMNDVGKNFEANFSQICQIVVKQNAARDIYVADVSSGLWKIERTEGQGEDEATVTRLTASGAADDTTCRGVQVKNDGTIWAIFDEEMCSSADDGSTWTVYNASTATQFKLSDVADTTSGTSNPDRLFGFTIDRYNAEDRFFIPARDATKLSHDDTTRKYFWWSRAGSSTGTSDEVYRSFSSYSYLNWNLRAGNDAMWCSKGGVWYAAAEGASGYMTAINWMSNSWYNQGYAWSSTYKTPVYGQKAHWWQDANGEEWVLGASANSSSEQYLIAVRSDRFTPADNTSSLSFFPEGLSYSAANPHEDGGKRLIDTFSTADTSYFAGSTNQNAFNMLGMVSPTTFIAVPYDRSYVQVGLTGSSFDSAGSPNVGDWIDYGWNGSAWVEGSTSSKATHTSRDTLVDGLTVKFDGTDAGSFVTSEYYDGYVYNGILKDDATTFSVGLRQTYLDVDTTTDFSSTVPTVSSGVVTEPAYLGDARCSGARLTSQFMTIWAEQGNWSTVGYLTSYPIMMRSEQAMLGDLTVTFKLAEINIYSNSSSGAASIGLIRQQTNPYSNTYEYSVHGDAVQFKYGGRPNTTDSAGDLTLSFYQYTGDDQNTVTLTDYDPNDDFKIERTSGNVKWYRNNVLIHTSNITGDNEKVNFFMNRNPNGGNFTLNDIELTYIDSDGPRVTVGDGVSTGASNPDFRTIVSNSTTRDAYNEIFIDGVPAIINYDVSLPPAGECTILPHSGKIRFDPSDAGATITGKIGYLKKF